MLSLLLGLLAPTTVVFSPARGLRMDLYRPATPGRLHPAVVVVHGGAYSMGDRKALAHEAGRFAQAGFVAASIDYRLVPKALVADMVVDCQTAVRYLRTHARSLGIDPRRIAAYGHSAGGQLALMLGGPEPKATAEWPGVSSRVGAVLSFAGPTDFSLPFPAYDLNQMYPALFGKPPAEAGPAARAVSPATYANRAFPPTYFIQGTKDEDVLYAQSATMVERLRAAGVRTGFSAIKGGGHFADWSKPAWSTALAKGIKFVRASLR